MIQKRQIQNRVCFIVQVFNFLNGASVWCFDLRFQRMSYDNLTKFKHLTIYHFVLIVESVSGMDLHDIAWSEKRGFFKVGACFCSLLDQSDTALSWAEHMLTAHNNNACQQYRWVDQSWSTFDTDAALRWTTLTKIYQF